jgi:hypothetical protein
VLCAIQRNGASMRQALSVCSMRCVPTTLFSMKTDPNTKTITKAGAASKHNSQEMIGRKRLHSSLMPSV